MANEVTPGLGRTGEWFGYNHYGVEPHIVTLGKSLGNGHPVSAVVIRGDIASKAKMMNLIYAQSHQNDPLGCTTANEVLRIFKEENILDHSISIGELFMNQLLEIQQSCSIVKDVRGRGLMLALELQNGSNIEAIEEKMLEKGYFIGIVPQYFVLRFFPALTISKDDILNMCAHLKALLLDLSK